MSDRLTLDSAMSSVLPPPDYSRLSPFTSISYVIIFIVIWSIVMFSIYVSLHLKYIKDNWATERCKPEGIWIGGEDNLQQCMKGVMGEVVGEATAPLSYATVVVSQVFMALSNGVQDIRNMISYVRSSMKDIAQDIVGRLANIMIPLQSMLITMQDLFRKTQAVLISCLYVGISTILTMKQILKMIVTYVIIILISLAAIIIAMWIFPFSWAVAAAFTAIFVSISIPLAKFLEQVSKITDLGVPSVPSKPHMCFDKYTPIEMADGTLRPLYKVRVGDVLKHDGIVCSKLKLSIGECAMYNLNGVYVTESHLVQYRTTWIPVGFHPLAKKVPKYSRDVVYCLNTQSGLLRILGNTFTDWDEMLDEDFQYISKRRMIELKNGIMIPIKSVSIGDVLYNGKKVTGIVKTYYKKRQVYQYENNNKFYHLYVK